MPIEIRELVIKVSVESTTSREIQIGFRRRAANVPLKRGELVLQSVPEVTSMLNRWGIGRSYTGVFVIRTTVQDRPEVNRLIRELQAVGIPRNRILVRNQASGRIQGRDQSEIPTVKLPVIPDTLSHRSRSTGMNHMR